MARSDGWSQMDRSRLLIGLLGAAIAGLYLYGLGSVPFRDPDEGMYAEIAREMLESGNWIVPTYNGVPYVEKPPLMYWLTAGTYAALGLSEFSARFWKVGPMLGTMALTYGLGRRLFSRPAGVLAMTILATTLGTFLFSRITQMDPLLVFGVTLSVYGLALAVSGDRPPWRRWAPSLCFWIGAAIGLMSKGLPGIVLPAALLVLWALIRRDWEAIRRVWSWAGAAVAAVFVVPWHVAAAQQVPGFFQFYVLDNQLLRFLGERAYAEDGNSIGTVTFLGVTVYALFPWTPYLLAALSTTLLQGWRGRWWAAPSRLEAGHLPTAGPRETTGCEFAHRNPAVLFLVGWLLLVIGGFAVSSFRLEYYALPAFPAAALLVAAFLDGATRDEAPEGSSGLRASSASRRAPGRAVPTLRFFSWAALVGGLVYAVAVAWAWWAGLFTPTNIVRGLSFWATNYRVVLEQGLPLPAISPGYYAAVLLGGSLLWVGGFAAALYWLRRDRVLAAVATVAVIGIGLSAEAASVLRQVAPHHSLRPLADSLNRALRPEDVLVHERGLEKSGGLLFYTRRKVLVLNGARGDLEFGSRLAGSRETFIGTAAFRELWASDRRVFLVTDLPAGRSAVSRAGGPPPVAVASTGTRWLYANFAVGSAPAAGDVVPPGQRR